MKRRPSPKKAYWDMTAAELAEATKEYDRPIPASRLRPLNKKERAMWERARRAPHRSVFIAREADGGVWVRLDPGLLKKASRYAARKKLSVSEVVSRSLEGMLANAG